MRQQAIEYGVGGTRFIGQMFWSGCGVGPRPGVLVFPEAFGLNEHAIVRAKRLAELGYVALAVDPHGEARVYSDLPSVSPAIRALYADRAGWRARLSAAYDSLCAQPQVDASRLAAIGFCFGGACCLELARSGAALAAIVTFHAGLMAEADGDAERIRAKVLICNGADDPLIKADVFEAVLAALRRDGVDWQLLDHGNTGHSFTNPEVDARDMPGFRYNAAAERRSWAAMRGLFDEVFA